MYLLFFWRFCPCLFAQQNIGLDPGNPFTLRDVGYTFSYFYVDGENARCILSTWSDFGSGLTDYACRSFDGLLSTYYKPRWEKFFADVVTAVESDEPFDQEAFQAWCNTFEYGWWQKD